MNRRFAGLILLAVALVVVPLAVLGAGAGVTADGTDSGAASTASSQTVEVETNGQFGSDNENTGYYEDGSAPTANPETDWTFNVSINNTGDGEVKKGGFGSVGTSAVVHDGVAYFGDTGHGIHSKYVYAVEVSTGELLWRQATTGDIEDAPTVHGDTVYVATQWGTLYAFDAETGTEQWESSMGDRMAGSPVVHDGSLYVGATYKRSDDKFYAVDATDGTLEWATEINGAATNPAVHNGTVYVSSNHGTNQGTLYAFDTETGHENWNYTVRSGFGTFGSPVVANGMVYLNDDTPTDPRVRAFDAHSGAEVWNESFDSSKVSTPAVAGCTVYVGTSNGTAHSLNAANGSVHWNATVPDNAAFQPAVASGTVYLASVYGPFADRSGNVTALAASDGSQRWEMAFADTPGGSPTPADGELLVGEGDRIHAISGDTGGSGSVDYGSCAGVRNGTGPTAHLHVSHPTVSVDETLTFDASPSAAHGRNVSEWEIDTNGDGHYDLTDTEDGRIEYTYDSPGEYEVALRVQTADGDNDTTNRTLRVAPAGDGFTAVTSDDWTEFGRDTANTGFNPNTTAPSGEARQAWSYNVSVVNGSGAEIRDGGFGSVKSASPVVHDGIAYFGESGHGIKQKVVFAVNVTTGERVWRYPTNDTFLGPLYGDLYSAPAVHNDTVYFANDCDCVGGGELVAVNATTGEFEWNRSYGNTNVRSSPTVANGTVYVGLHNGTLVAADEDNGDVEWTFDTKAKIKHSPAYHDGTVYVTSGRPVNEGWLFALNATTGAEQWRYNHESSVGMLSAPVVAHDRVYVGNGLSDGVTAFDADTGDQLWNTSTTSDPTAGVAVAGCTVYTATNDGAVHAFDATTGTEQWQGAVSGRVASQPSVANGMVYVTSDESKQLYALHAGSGRLEGSYRLDGFADTSPAVGDGMVVVGGGDEMMGLAGTPNASGVDYGGCSDVGTNQSPIASFTASGVEVPVGANVTLDAESSYDPDGTITEYNWSLSDTEATVSGTNGTVQVLEAGSYEVQLTVTDDDGTKVTTDRTITVYETETEETVTEGTATGDGTPAAEPAAGETTTEIPTTASGPGFGVVAAVVALLAATLLARRD
jgi:PGF-CTERM protein